jgi:large subunit ribosomal protein L22
VEVRSEGKRYCYKKPDQGFDSYHKYLNNYDPSGTRKSAFKSHSNANHLVFSTEDLDVHQKRKEARAVARYIRGAPSKFRRVLNTIRGRTYAESIMILEYMPYMACEAITKCLMSASSNAKNNFDMKKNNLYVQTAYCDSGPVIRRYRPRAQGKGFAIRKPTSHITIVLAEIK